jgi:hypothetical protein
MIYAGWVTKEAAVGCAIEQALALRHWRFAPWPFTAKMSTANADKVCARAYICWTLFKRLDL